MNNKKLLALFMAASMALATAFTGCAGEKPADASSGQSADPNKETAQSSTDKQAKEDLTILLASDIKSTDPVVSNDTTTHIILRHMYSRLVSTDAQGNILPDLAESWEQISPTEYTFKLKQGIKFQNGDEVKASDVKFSLERVLQSPRLKVKIEVVNEIVVDNDYQVTLKLSKPFAPLLANLSHPGLSILNEKVVTEAGDNFDAAPVGSGPMKFVEWVPNDHFTLERYDEYYGGPAKAKTLTFRVMPEGSSRTIALETGEADLVVAVDSIDIERVESNPDLQAVVFPGNSIEYVTMDVTKAPFDDIRVRQAFNYAINKQNIVDVVLEGRGEPSYSTMASTVKGYNDQITDYQYDPEKAKELLKEAGYESGLKVELLASGDLRNREAQLIQADLAAVGVDVEVSLLDWGAFLDAIDSGNYPFFILGWNCTSMDPDECMNPLFNSKFIGPSGNRGKYSNPKVDELLNAAEAETDEAKRLQMYKDAQVITVEDACWIPLHCKEFCVGIRKGLQGFEAYPSGAHWYHNLHY